ncbi:MAG: HDIG domain-containing protein [Anaerolineae bacterium]|nr:HDIG domain-containing protein [Anaerolineae bacterium]
MTEWAAGLLQQYLKVSQETAERSLHIAGVISSALVFTIVATIVIAFDSIFVGSQNIGSLQVGDIAPQNILAPNNITFTSQVLTERSRQEAAENVAQVYDPPDPGVARQQTQLARQILDFIRNVRRDPFGTTEQKINDIQQISALSLDEDVIRGILELSPEAWQAVDDQIALVLERVMRESIREADLTAIRNRLPTQVGISFNAQESAIIVAIVGDLVRANTFANAEETQSAIEALIEGVEPVELTFSRNEVVVREGERIDSADYEALQQLGLLRSNDNRLRQVGHALLASLLVVIVAGMFISRFEPDLFENSRFLMLLTVLVCIVFVGARIALATGQIYVYPMAALAMLFVSITSAQLAVLASLVLAFLIGLIASNSLEIATLACAGGLIGIFMLRRTERLNSFFFAGLVIGLINTVVVTVFNLGLTSSFGTNFDLGVLVLFGMLNGMLAAAVSVAGMYLVTLLFNLPTSLKLSDLAQPNQPLLQRLLREAPGTYQHSLQVANLSEQAALTIGANADLVRVAALYHDIGKMNNAAFFTENQPFDMGNPHDVLDDPYRSADIIISHVTDGDEMARQYHLPQRFRDFIREHHGTSQVYVFYRQAVNMAGGDESTVDISEFTYPGPKPQTKETAIMMVADSCEAAIRSIGPSSKQQISEIVQQIIDSKMRSGQLDDSGLTLNDIKAIRHVFVDMLQAVFHPRIDYRTAASRLPKSDGASVPASNAEAKTGQETNAAESEDNAARQDAKSKHTKLETRSVPLVQPEGELVKLEDEDDDQPLPEVPTLPRTGEHPRVTNHVNGKQGESASEHDETGDEYIET